MYSWQESEHRLVNFHEVWPVDEGELSSPFRRIKQDVCILFVWCYMYALYCNVICKEEVHDIKRKYLCKLYLNKLSKFNSPNRSYNSLVVAKGRPLSILLTLIFRTFMCDGGAAPHIIKWFVRWGWVNPK